MIKKLVLMSLVSIPMFLFAQFQIQGKVSDKKTNETLEGANLQLVGTSIYAISNSAGQFKLENVSKGDYTLTVTYVGYVPFEQQVSITENKTMLIQMIPRVVLREEVIVSALRVSKKTPTT